MPFPGYVNPCELEGIFAKGEALIPGVIRNGAVSVSSGDFAFHPPDAHELPSILAKSFQNAKDSSVIICDRGYQLTLDFAYNQFHWEGNKRTGTLMMNGLFLSNGILPCSVLAKRLQEYNTLLIDFYKTGGYKPLMDFYKKCHQTIYTDWKTAFPD